MGRGEGDFFRPISRRKSWDGGGGGGKGGR